jgi:hypothetical protein
MTRTIEESIVQENVRNVDGTFNFVACAGGPGAGEEASVLALAAWGCRQRPFRHLWRPDGSVK